MILAADQASAPVPLHLFQERTAASRVACDIPLQLLSELAMRILIAESDWLLSLEMEDALSRARHEVVYVTSTATDALSACEQKSIDLGLVNIALLESNTAGVDLAQRLHERLGVPSILTGGQQRVARTLKDVAIGFLATPFSGCDARRAVQVAQNLLRGEPVEPSDLPPTMELFGGLHTH